MLPLYQAFDALFPIGAYAFSGGLETYTQKGIVRCKDTLADYLNAQMHILPYGDIGVATKTAEGFAFALLDNLCSAMKQPYEIRISSQKLCMRFLKMQTSFEDYSGLNAYYSAILAKECEGHYPVAIGLFARDLRANLSSAMELYCYSILSAMVNQAVKLVPLKPSEGQLVLFDAMRLIPKTVHTAMSVSLDDLGVSGCGFDLRAMQHETLKGRLYSS